MPNGNETSLHHVCPVNNLLIDASLNFRVVFQYILVIH